MKFEESEKKFIHEKRSVNNSATTIITYKSHINGFIEYLRSEGYEDTEEVDLRECYYNYLGDLPEIKDVKDVTVASYARTLKAWLRWMSDTKITEIKGKLEIPKYQLTIRQTYSEDDMRKLLKRPQNGCSEVEYITWVMVNIFSATGMRLGTLRVMKVKDYSPSSLELSLNTTKNRLPVHYGIQKELGVILNSYIMRNNLTSDMYLFATGYNSPYAGRTIQDYIADYSRKRGVNIERRVHAFRHTFAKNYYERTHDVYKLQHILGHKQLSMTQRYLESVGCNLNGRIEYNPQEEFMDQEEEVPMRHRKKIYFEDE